MLVGEYFYYTFALHKIEDEERRELKKVSNQILWRLKELHQSFSKKLEYPVIKGFHSAIFDIDKNYLIGDFKPNIPLQEGSFIQGDLFFLVRKVKPHYLGAAYLVVAKKKDQQAYNNLLKELLVFTLFSLVVIVLTAVILGKLFLKPLKETVTLLDNFIKDATHELNTPINTIITNIELFKEFNPHLKEDEELKRIEIASWRLQKIFSDLSFLKLHHNIKKNIEILEADEILRERLLYFQPLALSKSLAIFSTIEECKLEMDRNDLETLFDNLISNAIKYTPPLKAIYITLTPREFVIRDEGIGIDKKDLEFITHRFFRANKDKGGFGLGLAIVRKICEYYGFELRIESKKNRGTKVTIRWRK